MYWININELCDKLQIKTWIIVTTADWFFQQNNILQVNQWGLALVMAIKEGGIGREGGSSGEFVSKYLSGTNLEQKEPAFLCVQWLSQKRENKTNWNWKMH